MGRKDYDYLDDERRKLWEQVVVQREQLRKVEDKLSQLQTTSEALSVEIEKKTPDHEREAKNASAQATRYKNKAAETVKVIEDHAAKIEEFSTKASESQQKLESIDDLSKNALLRHQTFEEVYSEVVAKQAELTTKSAALAELLADAEVVLEDSQGIAAKIEELKSTSESVYSKVSAAHSQAIKKGNEITELYDSVFGYTATEEGSDEDVDVPGLKAGLDVAYDGLKKNLGELAKELADFRNQRIAEFERFSSTKAKEFEQIKDQIKSLLPDAMTAGLSHAYEQKRKSEDQEGKKAGGSYWRSIALLLLISCIPVIVSLYSFFYDEKKLDQVIHNLPQVVLATLPLYAPAFWFAISASKRIKLARRLSEEYAHKEALSKTFEGLSTQISNLPDNEISRDLRAKLLYNIINVSSENPGRLISDYNNSDNPLLEVLDRSLSLTKSLEKIAAIPGVEKILKKVERRREDDLAKMENSVEENIDDAPSEKLRGSNEA